MQIRNEMPWLGLLVALSCLGLLGGCRADPAPASTDMTASAPADTVAAVAPVPVAIPHDALQEVKASMDRFLAARSFHAVMSVQGSQPMTNQLDYVAPDRYRMQMPVGTQLIIGDTMYMQMQGQHMQVPIPPGTLSQWRDPLKVKENSTGISAEYLGEENVDGQNAKKYRVHHSQPEPGEFLYWIGQDQLPLQLVHSGQAEGRPYTMTLRYSRFNDPDIRIEAP